MQVNQTTFVGATVFAIGLIAIVASFQISLDYEGGWGPRVFPVMIASVLLFLGAMQVRAALKDNGPVPAKSSTKPRILAPFLMLSLVVLYIWLIGKMGYLIATGLVVPAALALFGMRNPMALICAAIACPVIYHLIFFEVLGVFPPYGEWFDLLDLVKG